MLKSIRTRTIISSLERNILSGISEYKQKLRGDHQKLGGSTTLFCLSSNVHPSKLEELVNSIREISPRLVGCISSPEDSEDDSSKEIICSLASLPSSDCVSWYHGGTSSDGEKNLSSQSLSNQATSKESITR
jgi:hypothetical protein